MIKLIFLCLEVAQWEGFSKRYDDLSLWPNQYNIAFFWAMSINGGESLSIRELIG